MTYLPWQKIGNTSCARRKNFRLVYLLTNDNKINTLWYFTDDIQLE